MSLLRDIERRIDERLRGLFQSKDPAVPGQGRELVEIRKLILDAVDQRVQMLPRAKRGFPFNDVTVHIPAPGSPDQRAAMEAVFITGDALKLEIEEHLRRENVEFPAALTVVVGLIEGIPEPVLVCRNRLAEVVTVQLKLPQVGTSCFTLPDGSTVEFRKNLIFVGRTPEVLDERKRVVRRNDLVIDGDTVSRAHAHIEFIDGEYRLFDDGSSYGTSAIHDGRLVEVAKAGSRGLRLNSGDDLYIGQARLHFELAED